MPVTIHGRPGAYDVERTERYGRDAASMGSYFECVTAGALERWLSAQPYESHLFHDLGAFGTVKGHGSAAMKIGTANIDHLILWRDDYALIDAKGCAAGRVTTTAEGKGVIIRADGTEHPAAWLDNAHFYSAMGIIARLTGLGGFPAWVVPDGRDLDAAGLQRSRIARKGPALFLNLADIAAGELNQLPMLARRPLPARPEHVALLRQYLATPTPPRTLPAAAALPARPRYPWSPGT